MIKWLRFLSLANAIGIFIILEFVGRWPQQWLSALTAALLFAAISGMLVMHSGLVLSNNTASRLSAQSWWHLLPTPILLSFISVGVLLFLDTETGQQLLIVLAAFLCGLFWENVRLHLQASETYPRHYLESASLIIHVAVVWLAAVGFYRLLLDPSILPPNLATKAYTVTTVLILLMVFLLDYRAIWLSRYARENVWLLLSVETLLVSELFWVLNFLPFSPDVKALLVAVTYYSVAALGRANFDGTLRPLLVRRYAYFVAFVLAAVLLTSRWIV